MESNLVENDAAQIALLKAENEKLQNKIANLERLVKSNQHLNKVSLKHLFDYRSDKLNEIIFETDQHGHLIYISPMVEELLGYAPSEVIGKTFGEFSGAMELSFLKSEFNANEESLITEFIEFKTKSQQKIWLQVSTGKVYGNNQFSFLGTLIDVNEIKKNENKMVRLFQAVEQCPASIVITDLLGNIEYSNPKATETTGYSREELFGKNPRILKSGETSSEEYKKLWQNISSGKGWRGIFHNKRKDGTFYWESSQINPVINDKGDIINYIAIKEDITEQKKLFEALAQSEKRFEKISNKSKTVIGK